MTTFRERLAVGKLAERYVRSWFERRGYECASASYYDLYELRQFYDEIEFIPLGNLLRRRTTPTALFAQHLPDFVVVHPNRSDVTFFVEVKTARGSIINVELLQLIANINHALLGVLTLYCIMPLPPDFSADYVDYWDEYMEDYPFSPSDHWPGFLASKCPTPLVVYIPGQRTDDEREWYIFQAVRTFPSTPIMEIAETSGSGDAYCVLSTEGLSDWRLLVKRLSDGF